MSDGAVRDGVADDGARVDSAAGEGVCVPRERADARADAALDGPRRRAEAWRLGATRLLEQTNCRDGRGDIAPWASESRAI